MARQLSAAMIRTLFLIAAFAFAGLASACGTPAAQAPEEAKPVSTLRAVDEADAVRVAVLAIRSAVAANAQYGPIVAHLEESLGRPFVLVPVGQEEQFEVVREAQVEFTFNNPLSAVQLGRLYGTEFLATLSRRNTGPEFGGVIIARADSGIETASDLRGKNVTCVAFETAAAGCNFQIFHLLEQGVSTEDFTSFTETPSQDNIVLGVLNGSVDAGFVRTGQIERMLEEGTLLSLDELRIVDQAESDFHFPHSTRLYPEWPFAALAGADPELAEAARRALLALEPDHPAMVNAGAEGFVPAADYQPIDDLIVALKLRSWDAPSD